MKKLSVIGMTLLSIVTLSACATSSNNSSSKSKTENSYPLERYASSSETELPQKTTAYSDEAYVSFPYSVQADKKIPILLRVLPKSKEIAMRTISSWLISVSPTMKKQQQHLIWDLLLIGTCNKLTTIKMRVFLLLTSSKSTPMPTKNSWTTLIKKSIQAKPLTPLSATV